MTRFVVRLSLILLCLLLPWLALSCANTNEDGSQTPSPGDDDDDDNNDDDNDDDNDTCDEQDLCQRYVTDCQDGPSIDACLSWYTNPDHCLAMPFTVDCECFCLKNADCAMVLSCREACRTTYCPDESTLPDEPPIPGIPGQKEVPPTVPFGRLETPQGVTIASEDLEVRVALDPFSFEIVRVGDWHTLLATGGRGPGTGFSPLAFTKNVGFYWNQFYWGYRGYAGIDKPWGHAKRALFYFQDEDRVCFLLESDSTRPGWFRFVVGPFYDGAVRIAASALPDRGKANRIAVTFLSAADERYAGFGERFNAIDQRGRTLEHWSEEGSIEPGSLRPMIEQVFPNLPDEWALPGGETATYAPIPFYLSNRGYGFLADVPEPSHFDLADTHDDLFRLSVESDRMTFVVFSGPTPADSLGQYTRRTGRSQVPRPWVFAPWNMFVGYPGISFLTVAEMFREADIPSSVTHSWTDITPTGGWRGREAQLLSQNDTLHQLGYKSLCYLQPRVDKDRYPELWNDGATLDHFTRDNTGDPYILEVIVNLIHMTRFNVSLVDFTHEGVDDWWHGVLQTIVDLDFDGTMYDFGEYTPPDSRFADGRDGHFWHNPYPLIYQRSGYRFFRSLDDDPEDGLAPDYVYFHRSGYVGSQNWTYAMWSGDPEADWSVSDGLPAQVCAGVNVGLSGIPFWGSDIGGFHAILVPAPSSELLKRWVQFGAFSGLMRDMTAAEFASGSRILPFDEPDVTAIVRRYQKLRTQLVPYIVNAAWEAHDSGMPLMRAPFLHFPQDPEVWKIKREYLFGPDLYVAPVIENEAREKTLYLPPGRWVELWDRTEYDGDPDGTGGFRLGGVPIEGGRTITVPAPIDEIPLFVRMGAVIPLVDPEVDTLAGAMASKTPDVTTYEQLAHRQHVWVFAQDDASTTLFDGSQLDVQVDSQGVILTRTAPTDGHELVGQIVWPQSLTPPVQVAGLVFVADADPLELTPGTWTWSDARNAVAFHGLGDQAVFLITVAP